MTDSNTLSNEDWVDNELDILLTNYFNDGTAWRKTKLAILSKLESIEQEAKGCVDCKKLRCENCERLRQT